MATKKPAKKRTRSRTSKVGRPTKCTPETIEEIRKAIVERGSGREDAARAAGVGVATFHEWMARGARGEPGFADFLEVVEGAERDLVAKAEQVVVDLLGSSTPHAVRFAAAKLIMERRRSSVWAPRGTLKHEGPDGGPVRVAAQVEHSGTVALAPLVTIETLRALTRAETEAALSVELERQQEAEAADEEGPNGSMDGPDVGG
jgi:hypothetical protein